MHVEPPQITLTKSNKNDISDKYFVKIKLLRDPTSGKSDLYEFKMHFFDNSEPEKFLLFVRNFIMTLKASRTFKSDPKIHYLRTLLQGEALRQFDTSSAEVKIAIPVTLESIILCLGAYFFLLMHCKSKSARCAMEQGILTV